MSRSVWAVRKPVILILVFSLALAIGISRQSALGQSISSPVLLEGALTSSSTEVFAPMIVGGRPADTRSLGEVRLISGPTECSSGECYEIEVSCQQISRSERAELRVAGPTGSTPAGTILFATGWTGTWFWGGEGTFTTHPMNTRAVLEGVDLKAILSNNRTILDNLQADGFKTVEIKWKRNWFQAELGQPEGMGRLACKPATVVQWVYDNLHDQGDKAPYCASGWSNGASQMAYALSQYGLKDILTSVVMEGGPNWTYIDHACLHDDSNFSHLHAESGERNTIDWGFGYPNNGSGQCAKQNASWRTQFQEASLGYGSWEFSYPKTMVAFVIGGNDNTTTAAQGEEFYDLLVQRGSPKLSMEVVPGAPHGVTETPEGAKAMEDTLLSTCQLN